MYEELTSRLLSLSEIDAIQQEPGICRITMECIGAIRELAIEAADAIGELSKRETPMRVRITTSTKRCPSCNKQLSGRGNIHRNYRFCRWCGQALDWTEPPKEET